MNKSNVCIVGLGLLGGSYAMALSRKGHTVTAIDRDPAAIAYGLDRGLIQKGATADYAPLLKEAELVALCLYPHSILPWLAENQDLLSPGCLLTDVCGVKGGIVEEAQALLRRDVEFVPAHPMAGRERLGVQNADCAIFAPANFIINARRLFGIGAVKNTEKIELIVEMEQWNPEKIYDRMGVDTQFATILGVKIPMLTIPVKPGRNLAVILEVAAMNNRQKKMGYNAATELLDQLGLDMESKEVVKDYDAF